MSRLRALAALLLVLQGCGEAPDDTCATAVRDVFDVAVCGRGDAAVQHDELQWKIYNGICTDAWRDKVIGDCKEKCTGKKGVESGHCMYRVFELHAAPRKFPQGFKGKLVGESAVEGPYPRTFDVANEATFDAEPAYLASSPPLDARTWGQREARANPAVGHHAIHFHDKASQEEEKPPEDATVEITGKSNGLLQVKAAARVTGAHGAHPGPLQVPGPQQGPHGPHGAPAHALAAVAHRRAPGAVQGPPSRARVGPSYSELPHALPRGAEPPRRLADAPRAAADTATAATVERTEVSYGVAAERGSLDDLAESPRWAPLESVLDLSPEVPPEMLDAPEAALAKRLEAQRVGLEAAREEVNLLTQDAEGAALAEQHALETEDRELEAGAALAVVDAQGALVPVARIAADWHARAPGTVHRAVVHPEGVASSQ